MRKVLPLLLLAACTSPDELAPRAGLEAPLGATVESMVTGSCTTTSVWGLSEQVVEMMNCLNPGAMAEVDEGPNVSFGSAVFPFMQSPARDAFEAAAAAKPGTTLSVNSMLRTVVQQYLLYRWYQAGTCGIGLAATPGNSNHESGLALDINSASTWRPTLEAKGFKWLGASDPVHFDYVGAGAKDLGGEDVRAFQALWNQHNPGDLIAEDGLYGPQTGARIKASPADGFSGGVTCPGSDPPPVEDTWTPPPQDTWTPPEPEDTWTPPEPEDTWTPPEPEDTFTPPAPDDVASQDTGAVAEDVAPPSGADVAPPDVSVGPGDVAPAPTDTTSGDTVDSRAVGTVLPGGGCTTNTRHHAPADALLLALALAGLALPAWTRRRLR